MTQRRLTGHGSHGTDCCSRLVRALGSHVERSSFSRQTPLPSGSIRFEVTTVILSSRPCFPRGHGGWEAAAPPLGEVEDDGATGGAVGGSGSSPPPGEVDRRRRGHGGHGGRRGDDSGAWAGAGQRRIRFGSGLARLGAKVVQIWFRFGSGLARLGAKAVQIWFRFGSAWGKGGSDLVQVWLGWGQRRFRFGSDLVQIWFRFGVRPVKTQKGSPHMLFS